MICYVLRIDIGKNFVGAFNPAYKIGCFKWKESNPVASYFSRKAVAIGLSYVG